MCDKDRKADKDGKAGILPTSSMSSIGSGRRFGAAPLFYRGPMRDRARATVG